MEKNGQLHLILAGVVRFPLSRRYTSAESVRATCIRYFFALMSEKYVDFTQYDYQCVKSNITHLLLQKQKENKKHFSYISKTQISQYQQTFE